MQLINSYLCVDIYACGYLCVDTTCGYLCVDTTSDAFVEADAVKIKPFN